MLRALLLILALLPSSLLAGPESYRLDTDRSTVSFSYEFEGARRTGQMPVTSADLLIDLDNISGSRVLVTLDASAARAGFIIATEAMKSHSVLDTARFPDIHFRSTRIRGDLRGAAMSGDLTIRGVTRPVTLNAQLFRQRGTDLHDRNNLLIELTGTLNRKDFGAGGYPNLVGDTIGLRIIARISR